MTDLSLAALSAFIFASTDIDDLLILIGFFAAPNARRAHIVAGQFAGIAILVAASLAAAFVALTVSTSYVGFLGIAPLAIGVAKLWDLWAGRAGDAPDSDDAPPVRGRGDAAAVAVVTIANGADNLAVYTPLFATQKPWQLLITIAVFALMTLAWCLAAWLLVNHPKVGGPIRSVGRRALPFVLIGLGVGVLHNSGALALLASLVR
jgi:cadmium resistance protein CadD (predicted permease)